MSRFHHGNVADSRPAGNVAVMELLGRIRLETRFLPLVLLSELGRRDKLRGMTDSGGRFRIG